MGSRVLQILRLVLAVVMVANLLHAPSLALTSGVPPVDCLIAPGDQHHHSGPQDHDKAPGKASVCPFATAAAPLADPPTSRLFAVASNRLVPGLDDPLAAINPDQIDPPPRAFS
jgi:hypothetical protein